ANLYSAYNAVSNAHVRSESLQSAKEFTNQILQGKMEAEEAANRVSSKIQEPEARARVSAAAREYWNGAKQSANRAQQQLSALVRDANGLPLETLEERAKEAFATFDTDPPATDTELTETRARVATVVTRARALAKAWSDASTAVK